MASSVPCKPIPWCFNPMIYIDASNPAGTQVIPSDGSSLSLVKDLTGNGNDFTSPSNQPTYVYNQINSLNVIRGNGTNQFMSCANNTSNQIATNDSLSIFSICMTNDVSSTNRGLISKGSFPLGAWLTGRLGVTPNTSFTLTTIADIMSVNTFSAGVFQNLGIVYNSASGVTFYKNNIASADFKAQTGMKASTSAMNFMSVTEAGGMPWSGDIQCIIVFKRALNAQEVSAMMQWMTSKSGLS